jgi:oligo-1,6-glucosidase
MPHSTSQPIRHWWHNATVYQIYPASFKDSNADGFGDVPGIISKVDHIVKLGVDAVWLSPCYKSPNVDMGYDIADYRETDTRYGSVNDIEVLIAKLKEHGIKLLMDLVVNHTSDQHAWFEESRSSKTSPKRNWYIWHEGRTEIRDGVKIRLPPNNWESLFKGSAWRHDCLTDEFYLRIFAKEQPDLNWDNPELRRAVYDDMRFWLDKSIGGFRMDVINMISKPADFPDAPVTDPNSPWQHAASVYCNGPHVHEYLQELRREVLDHYPDIMTVGEVPFTNDPAAVRKYVEPERNELSMLFQFDIFDIDTGPGGKFSQSNWALSDLKRTITKWQQALSFSSGAWHTFFLESHDAARSVTRFGDRTPENRERVAKMLAMLSTTLGGTLFLHQGQEIGLANLADDIPVSAYPDIETRNFCQTIREQREAEATKTGAKIDMSDVEREIRLKARDHGRIPIPWDAREQNAGFSDAMISPLWTPMNSDADVCNVASQDKRADSVLNFWRKMLAFRKQHAETLVFGDFEPLALDDGPVFAYWRRSAEAGGGKDVLVVLNMTSKTDVMFTLPGEGSYSVLERTNVDGQGKTTGAMTSGQEVSLCAYEGMVLEYSL